MEVSCLIEKVPEDLMDFAYLPSWYGMLDYLESISLKENWTFKKPQPNKNNAKNPILENYIHHTYKRLAYEYNISDNNEVKNSKIYNNDNIACLNTGLFTKNYKYIYACFEKNKNNESHLAWVLKGFFEDTDPKLIGICKLPVRAEYFSDISDLIYDTKLDLRVNSKHILDNPINRERIPEKVRDLPTLPIFFDAAIELAKKKIEANYKVAVPQYYQGKIQFLIPISLLEMEDVDLALTVTKQDGYYTGNTCLTMDMAYNNARLISKPDSEWLKP